MNCNNLSSDKKRKARNDLILAALIIVIAVAGLLLLNMTKESGNSVSVKIDGEETVSFPLSQDTEYVIRTGENNENRNILVIKDGKAFISEADCPDGICKRYKAVSFVGETIVCLPHRVVIEVTGERSDNSIDVVV